MTAKTLTTDSAGDVLRQLLIDLGAAAALAKPPPDWPAFTDALPVVTSAGGVDTLKRSIVVHNTSGRRDGRYQQTGETIVHPGVQVRVRSEGYLVSRSKIVGIVVAFDGVRRRVVNCNGRVYTVLAIHSGDPIYLGPQEESQLRYSWVVNAVATITEG